MYQLVVILFCFLLLISCSAPKSIDRSSVSKQLNDQTGYLLSDDENAFYPPNVEVNDGVTPDEAVAIALWKNEQFQADLAGIGIAAADVTDASVVNNPLLRYLTPNAGLVVSGYINFAIDFIWQRPKRISYARVEADRVAASMIQRAYAIIRDVQTTYADLLFSKEKAGIMLENAELRLEMNHLAQSQLRHGEISVLQANTFQADAASAADEFIKATTDTILRYTNFITQLGFRADSALNIRPVYDSLVNMSISRESYYDFAYTNHPDLVTGRFAIESGIKKLGWERSRIVSFMGTLGFAHIPGKSGSVYLPNAFQPGIQAELPLFNRNQGKIERARAEAGQAVLQYKAIQSRVLADITNAYDRYEQAVKSLVIWNTDVLPTLAETVRLARSSYERGDISYLPVLEAMRQLLNGRLRQAEIRAEIRRSISLLNYTIGSKQYEQ